MTESPRTARRAVIGPILALAVLAPVCVDVVFGATRLSTPIALVPEVLTYGVAAVLIRETVRARRLGATSIVLLGLAFAVVSECLVVQTSLTPGAGLDVGRALGVNWPYLVWAVGYEAIWAILLPIRLTEALFPRRAASPWLGVRGRVALGVVFVLGCVAAWYQWTRVVRPVFLGLPVYQPPWPTLVIATLVAAGLVALALGPAAALRAPAPARRAPHEWTAAASALVLTLLWFACTMMLPSVASPAIAIVLALAVGAGAVVAASRWSRAPGWSAGHGLALVAGALAGNSVAGFVVTGAWSTTDLIAKIVVDLLVLGLVGWAAARTRTDGRRAQPA